jgi:hypothetical protein
MGLDKSISDWRGRFQMEYARLSPNELAREMHEFDRAARSYGRRAMYSDSRHATEIADLAEAALSGVIGKAKAKEARGLE